MNSSIYATTDVCSFCQGAGKISKEQVCPHCRGSGLKHDNQQEQCPYCKMDLRIGIHKADCPECESNDHSLEQIKNFQIKNFWEIEGV